MHQDESTEGDDAARGELGGIDAAAAAEDNEPVCEACLECHAKRENVSAGERAWDEIPLLERPEQVEGYRGLIRHASGKHIADLDGIEAWYDFPDGTEVSCSLKGAHRHSYGVVVRMLCDIVICMGKDCGSQSIVGFKAVHKKVKSRKTFHDRKRYLSGWAANYARRVAALDRPLRLRQEWLNTLRTQLRDLYKELVRRRVAGGREEWVKVAEKRLARTMLPEELESGLSEQHRRLVGLRLLQTSTPQLAQLQLPLKRFAEAEAATPAVDGQSAKHLAAIAQAADKRISSVETWVEATRAFVTEENLSVALIALGAANSSVTSTPTGLRVSYMPGVSAILPHAENPSAGSER